MELTFNDIETVFSERFDVPRARAVAFRGRLQHLQRLEVPEGSRTGRGVKAIYGWKQIVQLTVALDLLDLGLAPEVVAKAVKQSTHSLLNAVQQVLNNLETLPAVAAAIVGERCPFEATWIAVASAGSLTFAQAGEPQPYVIAFEGTDFLKTLREGDDPALEPTGAYIDLGSRLMLIAHLAGEKIGQEPVETARSLIDWFAGWANPDPMS